MRAKHSFLFVMLLLLFWFGVSAFVKTGIEKKVAQAMDSYENQEFENALAYLSDAELEAPQKSEINYNKGLVFYSQEKYEEADEMFSKGVFDEDEALAFRSLYNLASSQYRQGKLQESLENFKKALEKNPDDEDTKFNVEFVEKRIKELLNQMQQRLEEQKQQQSQGQEEQENQEQQKQQKQQGQQEGQEQQEQQNSQNQEQQGHSGSSSQDRQETSQQQKPKGSSGEEDQRDETTSASSGPDEPQEESQKENAGMASGSPKEEKEPPEGAESQEREGVGQEDNQKTQEENTGEEEQDESRSSTSGPEGKSSDPRSQGTSNAAEKQAGKELSKAEAERFLDLVDKNNQTVPVKKQQEGNQRDPYWIQKNW